MSDIDWEQAYVSNESLWATGPDSLLYNYIKLVPNGKVLDIGVGEGRNALYLAKKGFSVEGLDISKTAVERCRSASEGENLNLNVYTGDIRDTTIQPNTYSLIVATWILHFFTKSEMKNIVERLKNGLTNSGLIYITVFSTQDPQYKRQTAGKTSAPTNVTTTNQQKHHVSFFTLEEVLGMFDDFNIIHIADTVALDISHGKPHYHGFIEYMGKKSVS